MSNANLQNRAMLVTISVAGWSGRKLDREVTDQVNREHAASDDAGRYNKALVAPEALAKITAITNEARRCHYALSLPWLDDGTRIMSAAGYLEFVKKLRDVQARHDAAVAEFVASYDAYVAGARVRLNGMFKESDYPAAAEIAKRFRFERRIWPLPTAADFRVEMNDESAAIIRQEIEANTNAALAGAMRDAFRRVAETVGKMADRLAAYKPATKKGEKTENGFHESLVENVRELVDVLPALNLTGDARLTSICERMRDLVQAEAKVLKEHADVRKDVQEKAARIVADVQDYF